MSGSGGTVFRQPCLSVSGSHFTPAIKSARAKSGLDIGSSRPSQQKLCIDVLGQILSADIHIIRSTDPSLLLPVPGNRQGVQCSNPDR